MKALITLAVTMVCAITAQAQKNFIDQPYIETSASADTLVTPDKIYIAIILNEADSKNKKSTEDQERLLETTLKKLNINTEKDLTLQNFSSDFKKYFLKGQNILKSKAYSLMVTNAVKAGQVITELENVGISNVNIDRTEYSKAEQLIAHLKVKAIKKTKQTADLLVKPLNQKIGKAIHINENKSNNHNLAGKVAGITIRGVASLYGNKAPEPIFIEFDKLKFEATVNVTYVLE
jgi:uncharacterized protein YggE